MVFLTKFSQFHHTKEFLVNFLILFSEEVEDINHHRLTTMKKTFKKFLELVEGSSCDCRCAIYKGIHILKSLEVLM